VGVNVNDGIVTLSGTVSSFSERAAASEDAWVISGVRDVKNQLKVDVQKDVPSDGEIRSNIEQAFTRDNDLYPFEIQVGVVAGMGDFGRQGRRILEEGQSGRPGF